MLDDIGRPSTLAARQLCISASVMRGCIQQVGQGKPPCSRFFDELQFRAEIAALIEMYRCLSYAGCCERNRSPAQVLHLAGQFLVNPAMLVEAR